MVDDNEASRHVAKSYLEQLGFCVDTASSGKTALEMIRAAAVSGQQSYGLVFMDWEMPEIDGIETAKRIQQDVELASIPKIVMVTAHGSEDLIGRARQISLDGFLTKPVTQSLLFDAVMNAFGKAVTRKTDRSINKAELPNGFDNIRGSRILLVEDNAINQQLAVELLEEEGFVVVVAENGRIGLEKYKASTEKSKKTGLEAEHKTEGITDKKESIRIDSESSYDVVLMDLQMPVMDGRTAAREIRLYEQNAGIEQGIPIVAMTADAMSGVREEVLDIGMNDYVTKPIEPSNMFRSLVKCIKPGNRPLPDEYISRINKKMKGGDWISDEPELNLSALEGIDINLGLSRVSGNKKLYLNLLTKFCRDNQDVSQQIQEAIQKQEQELAVRLAHTVKGVAGTIGAQELQYVGAELEAALKIDINADTRNIFDRFTSALKMVLNTLESVVSPQTQISEIQKKQDTSRQGTVSQLTELLTQIEPFVQKRKPKPCKEIMAEMGAFTWPDNVAPQLQELDLLIGKYKFKEALDIVDELNINIKQASV